MISFKKSELQRQWFNSLNIQARRVALDLDELCSKEGYNLVVTSIFRSAEDQERVCKEQGIPYYASLHTANNAVDIVPVKKNTGEVMEPHVSMKIEAILNERFPYNHNKIRTVMWHKGTGYHFHIQINPREYGYGRL